MLRTVVACAAWAARAQVSAPVFRAVRHHALAYSTNLGRATTSKVTILDIRAKYEASEPLTMVTAYDYASARNVDKAGIDMILVGDSLAQVMLGLRSTIPVTMEEMLHHARAVSRGASRCFLVGDMPFGTYESSPRDAIANAARLLKEGGMEAVKLEGGVNMAETARAIVRAGIPVLGHIGLTPQTSSALGGFRVQGRTAREAHKLLDDALAIQEAGCFAIVLEAMPHRVASYIISKLSIPAIGIGAGDQTAGQVLVYHDMLGHFDAPTPKFCKQYLNTEQLSVAALARFKADVAARLYPGPEHTYKIKTDELLKLLGPDDAKALLASSRAVPPAPVVRPSPDAVRIAVIGAGAMGSLLAARLALASKDNLVWMIDDWADQIKRVQADGISVLAADLGTKEHATAVFATVPKAVPGAWDGPQKHAQIVIIAVKQAATDAAAALAARMLVPTGGVVLSIQNGLGHTDKLSAACPNALIVQGVMESGATLRHGTSTVVQNGRGPLTLGVVAPALDGTPATATISYSAAASLAQLVRLFNAAGLASAATDNVAGKMWAKLIVNACINPVTAVLGIKNGQIGKNAHARRLARAIHDEALAVVQALGVRLPVEDSWTHVLEVAAATMENTSSMLADIMRRQPTEIDAINGALVEYGRRLGVATPTNVAMVELVRAASSLQAGVFELGSASGVARSDAGASAPSHPDGTS